MKKLKLWSSIKNWWRKPIKPRRYFYWPGALDKMAQNVTLDQLKNARLFNGIGTRQFAYVCAGALKRLFPTHSNEQLRIAFKQILRYRGK